MGKLRSEDWDHLGSVEITGRLYKKEQNGGRGVTEQLRMRQAARASSKCRAGTPGQDDGSSGGCDNFHLYLAKMFLEYNLKKER